MGIQQNQQNVKRFDRWAATYDGGRLNGWFKRGQAKVLETINLRSGDYFLDIGCGTGWAVIQTAHQLRIGMACGIDISPKMIAEASALACGLPNVEFQVADAEAIPYPGQFFDVAVCTQSFHHYSNPIRALSEIHRVLKPGGSFVLLEPNRAGCRWVWLWDRVLRICETGHVRYYTEEEMLNLLIDAGFTHPSVLISEHGHLNHGKLAWSLCLISAQKRASD